MSLKVGFLFITLLVGSYAFPVEDKDMSIFFDHTDSSSRVVGGAPAGRVPYMVALSSGALFRNLICGGSLISTTHVLTAAHCVKAALIGEHLLGSLRVAVGTNRWNTGGTLYRVARYVIHPDYDPYTLKNDIGILITATDVALTNTVSLVPLSFDFINSGVPTSAAGWGITRSGGTISQELMQLSATVVDGERCAVDVAKRAEEINMIGVPPVDPKVEICAFNSEGRGMCNGDSGSPLMRADLNQQIGLVSWGLPCARGAPDMFARLSVYESWIKQIIN